MDIAPYRRLQLTLFVPEPAAVALDACRRRFDPAMASRISAHVTVLRWIPHLDALESLASRHALASCRLRLLDVRRAPQEHGGGIYVAIDDANGGFDRLLAANQPDRFSREFERNQRYYNRAYPDAHLPIIKLHGLRHTWATLALLAGIDIKIVSDRSDHSSTHITHEIYTHVTPPMQSDAAERVAAEIFRPS